MRLMVIKSRPLDLKGLCHRPGGTPGNSWWVYAARFFKSWPYFRQKKKCPFPHPFSDLVSKIHTRFQTWKRVTKRNITCLHKTEIMSSLLRLKPPQNDLFNTISNSHITLSFLFIWIETTNKLIHNRSSFVNHTRFPTKMGKIYTRFQTKTAQNLYPFGGTYVSGSYKGVPPPHQRLSCLVHFVNNANYATGWFAIWNLRNYLWMAIS